MQSNRQQKCHCRDQQRNLYTPTLRHRPQPQPIGRAQRPVAPADIVVVVSSAISHWLGPADDDDALAASMRAIQSALSVRCSSIINLSPATATAADHCCGGGGGVAHFACDGREKRLCRAHRSARAPCNGPKELEQTTLSMAMRSLCRASERAVEFVGGALLLLLLKAAHWLTIGRVWRAANHLPGNTCNNLCVLCARADQPTGNSGSGSSSN